MGRFCTSVYTEVEVDVDWEDIDTAEMIEELERRGVSSPELGDSRAILQSIYEKRKLGKDYVKDLDDLIYSVIGRI